MSAAAATAPESERRILTREGLGALLSALREDGHQLVGPTVRDGAIVHAEIQGIEDLPAGSRGIKIRCPSGSESDAGSRSPHLEDGGTVPGQLMYVLLIPRFDVCVSASPLLDSGAIYAIDPKQ
jgi:hypothetical protein